jgi:hypothetical protein
MAVTTERLRDFPLPYHVPSPTAAPVGYFAVIQMSSTSVDVVLVDDIDTLRNGRIVLGARAADRLDMLLQRERKPLPAPPARRADDPEQQ